MKGGEGGQKPALQLLECFATHPDPGAHLGKRSRRDALREEIAEPSLRDPGFATEGLEGEPGEARPLDADLDGVAGIARGQRRELLTQ